jgi:hypothetical protein
VGIGSILPFGFSHCNAGSLIRCPGRKKHGLQLGDKAMKDRKTPRMPAMKLPNLRKKLARNKVLGKQAKKKQYKEQKVKEQR